MSERTVAPVSIVRPFEQNTCERCEENAAVFRVDAERDGPDLCLACARQMRLAFNSALVTQALLAAP